MVAPLTVKEAVEIQTVFHPGPPESQKNFCNIPIFMLNVCNSEHCDAHYETPRRMHKSDLNLKNLARPSHSVRVSILALVKG